MPRPLAVTAALVAEVAERRRAGEEWKAIQRDLRARGLPFGRSTFWRQGVSEQGRPCGAARERVTQAA